MLTTINIVFAVLFLGGAFYFWAKTAKLKEAISEDSEESDYVLLSIQVPKNNDRAPQAAEQMFAALHGIYRTGAAKQNTISFEMVAKNRTINFFVRTSRELKDFVLSQVYAQYPNVEIKEVPLDQDYANPAEGQSAAMTELALKRPTVYPIKTFQNFDVDPLSAITGVLSSTGVGEEIWVQVIIRPIDDEWQDMGDKEIKNIKEPPPKQVGFGEIIAKEAKAWVNHAVPYVINHQVPEAKKEDKKEPKELAGPVQQAIKGIEEKITKLGFETNVRIVGVAPESYAARAKLEQMVGAFKQYNTINLNSFLSGNIVTDREALQLYQAREIGAPSTIFNITELASLYHFPSSTVSTPTINWAGSKKGEPPANLPVVGSVPADELTVFAETNFRNRVEKFGLKKVDRRLHGYIIGKTGTGKSTLIENMIYDDIREGRGVAVVDPHGTLIDHVLDFIPEDRVKDVVYFNPADSDNPIGFNLLENVKTADQKNVVASGVVGIFKKIFGESWGPRLEYILRNSIMALLDYPNSTLLGVMRVLTDNAFRRLVVNNVKDPVIRDFFVNEYEKYEPKFRNEAIAPIQNKVGQFLSSSTIRNIVGQPTSTMNISDIMDSGKILLADLSTGKIGEDNSSLLGSMLITKIQLAAMDRVHIPEEERRDFYLYVDEFQNFATDSFAVILSEARKYHLNLVMINQYISQMPEAVANAVFGNVGTMVAFRVGASDAESLKKEFEPIFEANDLVNLPNRQIYLKMAIDGVTVPAFSANTLPPPAEKSMLKDAVVDASRIQFSRHRADVEDYISDWSAPINLGEVGEKAVKKADEPTVKQAEEINIIEAQPAPVIEGAEEGDNSSKESIEGRKIQILKDRFDRQWYALSHQENQVGENEAEKITESEPVNSDQSVESTVSQEETPLQVEQTEDAVADVEQPQQVSAQEVASDDYQAGWLSSSEQPAEVQVQQPAQIEYSEPVNQEAIQNSQAEPWSGGGVVEEEPLISWDKADELGMVSPNEPQNTVKSNDEFQPIDEL